MTVNIASPRVLVQRIRADIDGLKQQGVASIYCDHLLKYLDEILASPDPGGPDPVQLEKYKADLQMLIESNNLNHQARLEMFRSVVMYSQQAMKSCFLLNGGAAVALLAFIGHLISNKIENATEISYPILLFGFGTFLATFTYALSYLTQWVYANLEKEKTGFVLNVFSILVGISSMVLFIYGLFETYHIFSVFRN